MLVRDLVSDLFDERERGSCTTNKGKTIQKKKSCSRRGVWFLLYYRQLSYDVKVVRKWVRCGVEREGRLEVRHKA